MKKNNYIPIVLMTVIFLSLVSVYGWVVVKINSFEQKNDELQANVDNETSLLKNTNQNDIRKKSDDEKNDLVQLNSFFVIQGQEFTLIQQVESLCQQSELTCSIKPIGSDVSETLPTNFQSLHMTVTANGKFSSLYKLGSILENLPYQISIGEMSLQQTGEGISSSNQWQEVFDFNVITKKQV